MTKQTFYHVGLIGLIAFLTAGCGKIISDTAANLTGLTAIEQKLQADHDLAVGNARTIFHQEQLTGRDFSNGPCLSDHLIDDWVLDVVHNPRQPIDDIPANQCTAYRNGTAHHFVEMDMEGNVVRVK